MIHQEFDITFFNNIFPIDKLRQEAKNELYKPEGEIITSPSHISVVEQLRQEGLKGRDASSVPTDVFVFAEGEPANRASTKVGGLPYWPKSIEWPTNELEVPLFFVGQICFADSKDIVPTVPGDVLVILADYEELIEDTTSKEALHFYWFNLTDEELISDGSNTSSAEWKIQARFGVRHRSVDYVEIVPEFGAYRRPYCLQWIEGTKIGGIPRWIQEDPELNGKFVASLGSIQPKPKTPYPFVNQPEPINSYHFPDELMWNDVGSLYIAVAEDGSIDWTIQSY